MKVQNTPGVEPHTQHSCLMHVRNNPELESRVNYYGRSLLQSTPEIATCTERSGQSHVYRTLGAEPRVPNAPGRATCTERSVHSQVQVATVEIRTENFRKGKGQNTVDRARRRHPRRNMRNTPGRTLRVDHVEDPHGLHAHKTLARSMHT